MYKFFGKIGFGLIVSGFILVLTEKFVVSERFAPIGTIETLALCGVIFTLIGYVLEKKENLITK